MDEQLQLLLKVCSGELQEDEKKEYGITDEVLSGIQQACNFGYSAAQYKGLEDKIDNLTHIVSQLSEKVDVLLLSSVSSTISTSNLSSTSNVENNEDKNYEDKKDLE